ncbi:unnamed protein product [Victoria cruziana]
MEGQARQAREVRLGKRGR